MKQTFINSMEKKLDLDFIRKELGDDFLVLEDNIAYACQKIVERFATKWFGRLPYLNQLTDKKYNKELIDDGSLEYLASSGLIDSPNYRVPVYDEDCDEEEMREKRANLDMNKTLKHILEVYPESIVLELRGGTLENCAIFNEEFIYYGGVFYMDKNIIPEKILNCKEIKKEEARLRWILMSSRGYIDTHYVDIKPKGGFEENYNDDFYKIHEKITNIIHEDSSSIMILHGKPGTGKSSYLRELIAMNKDLKFYWLDASMFSHLTSKEFTEYLISCKNGVFILEDSETLLKSREDGTNWAMQSLLNISDGMLGDAMNLKFICTFNTDLSSIDSALLRKGRLKVKYEFKPLSKDKVAKIFKEKGIDTNEAKTMPLCDVYNFLEDNGAENKERKKIGFN